MSDTPKSFKQTTLDFSNGNEHLVETPIRNKRSKDDMIKSPPLTLESMKNDIKTAMAESEERILKTNVSLKKLTNDIFMSYNIHYNVDSLVRV